VEWLTVTLAMYRKAFHQAAQLVLKNWLVLGTVFVYMVTLNVGAIVAGLLPIVGGFLYTLVLAACVGSFLSLVEMMVRTSRVTFDDFKRSFGAYLWDVVGVSFLLWLFSQLAVPALLSLPQGTVIVLCAYLAIFVFGNAVPELIYVGHFSSMALLQESYGFVLENWIEWFPANLIAATLVFAIWSVPVDGIFAWIQTAVIALLIYFVMVMRGLLFRELHGSSRRSRAFRHRMGS
jgi:hypothetical protein